MGVAGRSGKTAREAEVADDVLVCIDEEFEAKAGGVIEAAAEAVVEGSVGEGSEGIFFAGVGDGRHVCALGSM
jgi:hypothetical protein